MLLHADSEDWADAQADLSLRLAHTHFVGFVMSWLIYVGATLLQHVLLLILVHDRYRKIYQD